jgi:hypothetical protein
MPAMPHRCMATPNPARFLINARAGLRDGGHPGRTRTPRGSRNHSAAPAPRSSDGATDPFRPSLTSYKALLRGICHGSATCRSFWGRMCARLPLSTRARDSHNGGYPRPKRERPATRGIRPPRSARPAVRASDPFRPLPTPFRPFLSSYKSLLQALVEPGRALPFRVGRVLVCPAVRTAASESVLQRSGKQTAPLERAMSGRSAAALRRSR